MQVQEILEKKPDFQTLIVRENLGTRLILKEVRG